MPPSGAKQAGQTVRVRRRRAIRNGSESLAPAIIRRSLCCTLRDYNSDVFTILYIYSMYLAALVALLKHLPSLFGVYLKLRLFEIIFIRVAT